MEQVKVLAVPTFTKLGPDTPGSVVVGGSHAAIFTTYLTLRAGARAAIQHDAALGLDQAGIRGLVWAEQFGFAVAAVPPATPARWACNWCSSTTRDSARTTPVWPRCPSSTRRASRRLR